MPKKLIPRQKAARQNRAKRPPLSPESRERLRQAALVNRPWEYSTGPKTPEGKKASRENALRHGARSSTLLPCGAQAFLEALRAAERCAGVLPTPLDAIKALDDLLEGQHVETYLLGAKLMLRYQRLVLGATTT